MASLISTTLTSFQRFLGCFSFSEEEVEVVETILKSGGSLYEQVRQIRYNEDLENNKAVKIEVERLLKQNCYGSVTMKRRIEDRVSKLTKYKRPLTYKLDRSAAQKDFVSKFFFELFSSVISSFEKSLDEKIDSLKCFEKRSTDKHQLICRIRSSTLNVFNQLFTDQMKAAVEAEIQLRARNIETLLAQDYSKFTSLTVENICESENRLYEKRPINLKEKERWVFESILKMKTPSEERMLRALIGANTIASKIALGAIERALS